VARKGDRKYSYRILVRRSKGRRNIERTRHRWENNIKRVFSIWNGKAWLRIGMCLALSNAVMNLRVK
jgi:hypothetical protein